MDPKNEWRDQRKVNLLGKKAKWIVKRQRFILGKKNFGRIRCPIKWEKKDLRKLAARETYLLVKETYRANERFWFDLANKINRRIKRKREGMGKQNIWIVKKKRSTMVDKKQWISEK